MSWLTADARRAREMSEDPAIWVGELAQEMAGVLGRALEHIEDLEKSVEMLRSAAMSRSPSPRHRRRAFMNHGQADGD